MELPAQPKEAEAPSEAAGEPAKPPPATTRDLRPEGSGPRPAVEEEAADPLLGVVLADRYRLLERIGEGGMGAVYRGEHISLKRLVAVKFLHAEMTRNADVVARFEREAQAAARLDHPNVVAVNDFGKTTDGTFFLVMEFIKGRSLRKVLDDEGRFPLARVLHVAKHIGAALARAHANEIVHRDLKPDNVILVERDGDTDFAKVIDFGIAKVGGSASAGGAITQAGMVFGTPEYMAPEQALGATALDHRADLYAFAVMVFEMITGRRPFLAEEVMELLGMHLGATPPTLASLAPELASATTLEAVLQRALAKKPADRFASAAEFVEALTGGVREVLGGASFPPGTEDAAGISRRLSAASITGPLAASSGPTAALPAAIAPSAPGAWDAHRVVSELSQGGAELAALGHNVWENLEPLRQDPKRLRIAQGVGVVLLVLVTFVSVFTAGPPRGATTNPPPIVAPVAGLPPPPLRFAPPPPPTRPESNPPGVRPAPPPPPVTANNNAGASLAERLREWRAQPDVAPILAVAERNGGLRESLTLMEGYYAVHDSDALAAYSLAGLYRRDRNRMAFAIERYRDALRLDPSLVASQQLVEDVAYVYEMHTREQPQAETLLRGQLAPYAAAALLEVLSHTRAPAPLERARRLLSPGVLPAPTEPNWAGLAMVLGATTCEAALPGLELLRERGDARALDVLERIPFGRRCHGCNPCMAEAMPATLAALRARRP